MIIEAILEKWFARKISLKKIEEFCSKLEFDECSSSGNTGSDTIRTSCVQRQIRTVRSIEQYINILYGFVRQAACGKSQLIVFPEYNFFDLFGLFPGFGPLNRYLNRKAANQRSNRKETESEGNNTLLSAVLRGVAVPVEKGIKKIASILAKQSGLYIYTGSYMLKEDGVLYNAGSLFGPDGKCIGTQKKIHLTDFESHLGMGRDTKIEVYSLPAGKVSFPVCMDATYFETFHIAREKGADIVIIPIANMGEYNPWSSLRGIWPRVQESYVYGLKSSLNGWIAGMHFTGKAGIFAPLSMTPNTDGVLALSPHHEDDHLVTAEINIKKLHEERERAEYHGDSNPEFERGYVEKVYFKS